MRKTHELAQKQARVRFARGPQYFENMTDILYSNVQFESGLKGAAGGVNIVICRLFEFNRHPNEIEAVSMKNSPWFGPALSTFITGTSVPLSISPELNT